MKELFLQLCEVMNLPYNETTAKKLNKTHYLFLDFSSYYGGYRIVSVKVGSGAHYGAFGGNGMEARLPKKQMQIYIKGLIEGYKYANETNV